MLIPLVFGMFSNQGKELYLGGLPKKKKKKNYI